MTQNYVGTELEVFAHARNWKRYVRERLAPFLRGDVLEIGAGIGATTLALRGGSEASWTCVEPDPALARALPSRSPSLAAVEVVVGTIDSLAPARRFDCVLYIDVLEHIEDDAAEARRGASRLNPGGALVVLAPAHQSLFSPFDAAVGHYRRYDKAMLRSIAPPGLELVRLEYLDSTGWILSLLNRLVLKSSAPTRAQVLTWDRYFIPVSRLLDPILGRRAGKSVLAVWRRR
ncbi:MAG TPA: class I SAM-dependent methyltransferase [Vicinamibacterales bacterium]